MVPVDYAQGQLVLKLDHEETLALDAKLYDLIVTYKITDVPGSYGGSSDQNSRVTFVLEAKDGAVTELRPSIEDSTFLPNGDDRVGGRMEGPVLNNSKSGLNTVQVHLTNYTGTYKMQGTVSLQPTDTDYFEISKNLKLVSSIYEKINTNNPKIINTLNNLGKIALRKGALLSSERSLNTVGATNAVWKIIKPQIIPDISICKELYISI